ncbi:DUF4349 domain-containing protein [Amycolatopsis sp. NPDC059027]|uniref:DUF4349 domain-containing protein n=1 Tax=Amycolatopsis sp. NPDC059027 TaxID=3346709 RepID=UPI00367151BD
MRTRWRAALAAAGLALVLAGCTNGAKESAAPMRADSAGSGNSAPVEQGKAPQPDKGKSGAPVPVGQPGVSDRKLVRTARLELSTPKVADVIGRARQVSQAAGGYTGQESSGGTHATLSLAVPAEKLDGVLDELAGLGKTVKRELNTQDVTEQTVDVEARLATQRASVERMRALLAKATSVTEISSVETELTRREADLESLEQRRNSLAGSVAMSTITLTVSEGTPPPAPAPEGPSGFLGGLAGGWHAFLVFGGGLLTVVGAMAPFLLVLGVPTVAVLWYLRKRREAKPSAAEPEAAEIPTA